MRFMTLQSARAALPDGSGNGTSPELDGFPAGLGLLDDNLHLLQANDKLRELLGIGKLLGGGEFFHLLRDTPALETDIRQALQDTGRWQGIIHHRRALRLEISRRQHADGSIVFPLLVMDFSADYKQMQQLVDARHRAEKTDKAKSQFISQMSHELRTPLNAILGFTQILQAQDNLGPDQQDNVREIESAGNYLLGLINELLDLSRIEAGKIQLSEDEVMIEGLLRECIALTRPLAEARAIHIDYEVLTRRAIHADHIRLKQILLNLLSNAVKYNQEGGSICIQCRDGIGDSVHLEVRDTGPGLAADQLESIFSPFERLGDTARRTEGTGIGLMITRKLVQLMGGTIGVLSEPGMGSVFWVNLPAAADDASSTGPEAEAQLYCIGFNPAYRELLTRMLRLRPHIQAVFTDFLHEAVPALLQHKPRAVLLSPQAAYELSLDARNLVSLKLLGPVVVETESTPGIHRPEPGLFKGHVPAGHSLHELLMLVDDICTSP